MPRAPPAPRAAPPNSDAGRSIFDGSGGLGRSVLELQINALVGSFQIRRIALQGGDALNSAQRFNHGGGLAIYGQASVLIGAGTTLRNNAAGNGGGVALVAVAYAGTTHWRASTSTSTRTPKFAGQLFAMPFAPANPNRTADLGAIEYRPEGMFANGFE